MPISWQDFKQWQSLPRDAWSTESEDLANIYRRIRSIIVGLLIPRYEKVEHTWPLLVDGIESVLDAVHARDFSDDGIVDSKIRDFVGVAGLPGFELPYRQAMSSQNPSAVPSRLITFNHRCILLGLRNLTEQTSPFAGLIWKNRNTITPMDLFGLGGICLPHEEDARLHREFDALFERCREQLGRVRKKNVDALIRRFLLDETPTSIVNNYLGERSDLPPSRREEHDKMRDRINSAIAYSRKNRPLTEAALRTIVPSLKL